MRFKQVANEKFIEMMLEAAKSEDVQHKDVQELVQVRHSIYTDDFV
jgi:hypothetical protein